MARDLAGRKALVTGSARRIGREIVLALAEQGVDVVVHYRASEAEARQLADEVRKLGLRSGIVQADLRDQSALEGLIQQAAGRLGGLDILVNNASEFPESTFEALTLDDLVEAAKVNAWAPFELGRRFAESAGRGAIVNVLDTRITDFDWRHVGYSASKQLLAFFTRMMALKLAPDVSVNAVAPGLILPPEGKDEHYLESLKGQLPLQKVGSPREVADAVVYLASSSFITGQVIYIDGGRHVREGVIG